MLLSKLITGDGFGPQIARKGGGGGGTSTSGIAPEFKPHLEGSLSKATEQLDKEWENQGAAVAGLDPSQQEGLRAQEALSREAIAGTGRFDDRAAVDRQLQNLAGQQAYSMQGNLGSARGDRARQAALADASFQFGQKRQQDAIAGAAGLQQAGQQRRMIAQEQLDAPHKSLDRYFGYLSGAPQQTTTSQSGGK